MHTYKNKIVSYSPVHWRLTRSSFNTTRSLPRRDFSPAFPPSNFRLIVQLVRVADPPIVIPFCVYVEFLPNLIFMGFGDFNI